MVIMDILRYHNFLRDHACKHEFWSMLKKQQISNVFLHVFI